MYQQTLRPSKEVVQKVRESVGLDERSTQEAVQAIKQWLQFQPHLPDEDDGRLERLLVRCKNNIEKTKQTIDMYFTLKSQIPELMSNWDLNDSWAQNALKQAIITPVPTLTEDFDRINIVGFSNDNEDFNVYDYFKLCLMSYDLRTGEDYFMKDIFIVDFKNLKASHVTQFTLPAIKKIMDCILKGCKCRVRGMHMINTSPITEIIISILKSVLSNKLAQRIYVYGSDLTELYNHVPRSLLPKEFGGENGTLVELGIEWQKKLLSYHDWFLEQEKKKSDESKRPSGAHYSSDMFGVDGSFRKINID